MQVIKEFVLRDTTLLCPTCNSMFGTKTLSSSPDITCDTPVEADLHRVLPDAALRAAFVAMCVACGYAWWVQAFQTHPFDSKLLPKPLALDYPKRFAHAVLTGRSNGSHSLDLALLALNGYWCSREAGNAEIRYLELAHHEMDNTLKMDDWEGSRGYYHYVMGEICRQLKDFKAAILHFEKVTPIANIPQELLDRQKVLAISGDSQPAIMPKHLVEVMFVDETTKV